MHAGGGGGGAGMGPMGPMGGMGVGMGGGNVGGGNSSSNLPVQAIGSYGAGSYGPGPGVSLQLARTVAWSSVSSPKVTVVCRSFGDSSTPPISSRTRR